MRICSALVAALICAACVEAGGVLEPGEASDAGVADAGFLDAGFFDAGVDAGQPPLDEAGDEDDPLEVTLPLSFPFALDPAGDVDCFRFTLAADRAVRARVSAPECDDAHDAALTLDGALRDDDEAIDSRCPAIATIVGAGEHVLCASYWLEDAPLAIRDLQIDVVDEDLPICGDEQIGLGERCDDGNAVAGDGCDDTCSPEPGFSCPAGAGACVPIVAVTPADLCADAPTIDVAPEARTVLDVDMSGAVDDVSGTCTSGTGGPDAFLNVIPRASGTLHIETVTEADTLLIAFAACGGEELACNDDGGDGLASLVELQVTRDVPVIVAVDFFSAGAATDSVALELSLILDDEVGECDDDIDGDGDGAIDCADTDCDGDPRCGAQVPVQDVQSEVVALGAHVTFVDVYVTARRVVANGNTTLVVQEPEGETPVGIEYPRFAAASVFITSALVPTLPNLASADVGACISVSGDVGEFQGQTQLSAPTFLALSSSCGAPPTPHVVALEDIATDLDPNIADAQPGALAEIFETVLLEVNDVVVQDVTFSPPSATVTDQNGVATLTVGSFFFDGPLFTIVPGQQLASVVGVLEQFTTYQLSPRDSGDVQ